MGTKRTKRTRRTRRTKRTRRTRGKREKMRKAKMEAAPEIFDEIFDGIDGELEDFPSDGGGFRGKLGGPHSEYDGGLWDTEMMDTTGDPSETGSKGRGGGVKPKISKNSSNRAKTLKWTPKMDKLLLQAVEKYGVKQWTKIAQEIAQEVGYGVTNKQCYQHWNSINPLNKQGGWTDEQDQLIREFYEQSTRGEHKKWKILLENETMKGRTKRMCAERWEAHLDPMVNRGGFTEEENSKIKKLVQDEEGWAEIARQLGLNDLKQHRRPQDVRYYWQFNLSRRE